jgi:hypothetical protein
MYIVEGWAVGPSIAYRGAKSGTALILRDLGQLPAIGGAQGQGHTGNCPGKPSLARIGTSLSLPPPQPPLDTITRRPRTFPSSHHGLSFSFASFRDFAVSS